MSLEERLEKIRSGPVPQNEESAKFQVIAPILENLGWDQTDGSEFLLEYAVGGTKGGRVDIALRANTRGQNRLVALIEAKVPGSDLKRHVAQVLGYAFHEGVDICVLTTGLEWWLFLPRESGEPIQRRFATLDMRSDSVERLAEDLRAFLDKEALVRGRAEKKAKSVLKATLDAARLETEIPEIWERMLNGPDQELVDLIGARVYERLNLRPDKSQVIAALRGKPVPMVNIPEDSPPATPEVEKAQKSPAKNAARNQSRSSYGEHDTRFPAIKRLLARWLTSCMRNTHPISKRCSGWKGRTRVFAARNEALLYSSHRVESSEYFVECHGNAQELRERAGRFLDCFGYDKSELDVLFE